AQGGLQEAVEHSAGCQQALAAALTDMDMELPEVLEALGHSQAFCDAEDKALQSLQQAHRDALAVVQERAHQRQGHDGAAPAVVEEDSEAWLSRATAESQALRGRV